jgi:hypothetical protein
VPEFILELFNAYVRYTSIGEYLEMTLRGTLFKIIEQEFRTRKSSRSDAQENAFFGDLAAGLLKQITSAANLEIMPFGLRVFAKQIYR